MNYDTWIVTGDHHVPFHDRKLFRAYLAYIEDEQPTGIVLLGDFLDFAQISKFNRPYPGKKENARLKKDTDMGKAMLTEICRVCPNARVILLGGNHEYRLQDYLYRNPELIGSLDLPVMLGLPELGIEWIESWSESEALVVRDATFIHGWYTGMYHAKKHALTVNHTVYTGHTHDVMEYPLARLGGGPLVGKSLGCSCTLKQEYTKGRPNNWQQAIGVLHFPKGGKTHQEFTIKVEAGKGRFIAPNGKVYNG